MSDKAGKTKKAKRDTPSPVPVDLGSVRYAIKVYTAEQIDEMLKDLPSQELIEQHIADKDNPHGVTKDQVGLGNVDNTSDADKPLSTAAGSELSKKVAVVEPVTLSWTEDGTTHETGITNYDAQGRRLWSFIAYNMAWQVYTYMFSWETMIRTAQGDVGPIHGVVTAVFATNYVTFTYNGTDYKFKIGTTKVLDHLKNTNNPHGVTGQQVGVLGSDGKVAAGLVVGTSMAAGAVGTNQLANNAVTSGKLGAGSVSAGKLSSALQDAIGKNVNASVSVSSPKLIATQAGGIIVNGLDGNWWSIGIDANGDLYKTRVDPPTATTNIADIQEEYLEPVEDDDSNDSNDSNDSTE